MTFWEFVWLIVIGYLFIAYLFLIFTIFADLFRDRELGGGAKFLWILFIILMPFLAGVIYIIARGQGMAARQVAQAAQAQAAQESYIQSVASSAPTPADQISSAKALLDSGAITTAEYENLKAKALA